MKCITEGDGARVCPRDNVKQRLSCGKFGNEIVVVLG